MVKATITATGKVTIPMAVRDELDLKPGTQVILEVQDDSIVVRRLEVNQDH
jgi:AbrB family looped-hinge helix DNA binding protein